MMEEPTWRKHSSPEYKQRKTRLQWRTAEMADRTWRRLAKIQVNKSKVQKQDGIWSTDNTSASQPFSCPGTHGK